MHKVFINIYLFAHIQPSCSASGALPHNRICLDISVLNIKFFEVRKLLNPVGAYAGVSR